MWGCIALSRKVPAVCRCKVIFKLLVELYSLGCFAIALHSVCVNKPFISASADFSVFSAFLGLMATFSVAQIPIIICCNRLFNSCVLSLEYCFVVLVTALQTFALFRKNILAVFEKIKMGYTRCQTIMSMNKKIDNLFCE